MFSLTLWPKRIKNETGTVKFLFLKFMFPIKGKTFNSGEKYMQQLHDDMIRTK